MRELTEKHIRELVRAWYGTGGVTSIDPNSQCLCGKIENYETHLVAPIQRDNAVVVEGSVSRIEIINLNLTNVDDRDFKDSAKYNLLFVRITGDIPESASRNLYLYIASPIRGSFYMHSAVYERDTVTPIEHGPYKSLSAYYAPFSTDVGLGYESMGSDRVPVTCDGVHKESYVGIITSTDNLGSGGSDVGASKGLTGNPFGLVTVDWSYATSSVGTMGNVVQIRLGGLPRSSEIILGPYAPGYRVSRVDDINNSIPDV